MSHRLKKVATPLLGCAAAILSQKTSSTKCCGDCIANFNQNTDDTPPAAIIIARPEEPGSSRSGWGASSLSIEEMEAELSRRRSSRWLKEKQEIIDTCLQMNATGLNQGTSGNVSVRVDGGFLITPSGVEYKKMTPDMVVFMDLEGGYYGDFLPSSEWRMHYDVYKVNDLNQEEEEQHFLPPKNRPTNHESSQPYHNCLSSHPKPLLSQAYPAAKAILHAHPTYSTALSVQRRGIPAFHYMIGCAGGKEIRCAPYATFGSQELSDSVVKGMRGGIKACLMANHGMICYEKSLAGQCLSSSAFSYRIFSSLVCWCCYWSF